MRNGLRIAMMTLLVAVSACGDQAAQYTHVNARDQAASVLVSVNSVAPWSQVSAAMAPNFSLKGDTAASAVFQATARMQDQVLNALGLSLGIGLVNTSTTGNVTRNSATGTTSNFVNNVSPGVTPTPATGVPAGGGLPGAATPIPSADVAVDPVLQYQAARNLFQAVTLMNNEVQTAAILDCYVPFMVLTKLAIGPYRPALPYALQARISFYPDSPKGPTVPTQDACDQPAWLPRVVPVLAADDLERAIRTSTVEVARQVSVAIGGMLHGIGVSLGVNGVNQQLNALVGSEFNNRLSIAREADNTLNVRINPTEDGGAGAALVGQSYDVALLLLVPRAFVLQNGTLRPPNIQVVTRSEFRDATTDVPLPDRDQASFVAQVDHVMKDALWEPNLRNLFQAVTSGASSTSATSGPGATQHCPVPCSWMGLPVSSRELVGRALVHLVRDSQSEKLVNILSNQPCIPPTLGAGSAAESCLPRMFWPDQPALEFIQLAALRLGSNPATVRENLLPIIWTGASSLLADEPNQEALFQLPVLQPVSVPPQIALFKDDGKGGAQVVLSGVTGGAGASLLATLASGGEIIMEAPSTYDATASTLTFAFPTIGPTGKTVGSSAVDLGTLTLTPICNVAATICPDVANIPPSSSNTFGAWLSTKASAATTTGGAAPGNTTASVFTGAATGFSITTSAKDIVTADGTGKLQVTFAKFTDAQVVVTVSGGPELTEATQNATSPVNIAPTVGGPNNGGIVIPQPASSAGTFILSFQNLQVGQTVKVDVQGQDKTNQPIKPTPDDMTASLSVVGPHN